MGKSVIEWTARRLPDGTTLPGYTFNIVWGCQKVSEGCKYCYADTLASRYGYSLWGPQADRRVFGSDYWARPLRWNEEAEARRMVRLVFCSSMADVFEDHSVVALERQKLWPLIEATPWLIWLLLTKRPENVLRMVPYEWLWPDCWPGNVWVGTSVENQRRAVQRIPVLCQVPASVRFLSCEPLLETVSLQEWIGLLDWVIVGGESGVGARPMALSWARDLRDQCQAACVPFFFKQWGGRTHASLGRLLDGRTWDEMPFPV